MFCYKIPPKKREDDVNTKEAMLNDRDTKITVSAFVNFRPSIAHQCGIVEMFAFRRRERFASHLLFRREHCNQVPVIGNIVRSGSFLLHCFGVLD